MKKDIRKLTIEEIINELPHYTDADLMELSISQLLEIWYRVSGLEEDKQYSGLLEEE